jgi:TolA-binding protein
VAENAPGSPPADTMKEGAMPELTAEQARQLEEAAETRTQLAEANKRIEALEGTAGRVTDLEQRLTEADARNQRLENDRQARALVAAALTESGLPDLTHARVTETVCRDLPTGDGGALDEAKLGEAIKMAVNAEKAYVAALAEASGAGAPRGLGGSGAERSEADIDKELAESFAALGLDERAALTAAQGRG